MENEAQARAKAIMLLNQGKSAAEIWDALVSNGVEAAAAETVVRELIELRRQAGGAATPAANVVAPPVATLENLRLAGVDVGHFWLGFLPGLFCGCWALLYYLSAQDRMGSETKRGMQAGLVVNFVAGVLLAFLSAARGR